MAQMTVFQAAICAHHVVLYGPVPSTIVEFAAKVASELNLEYQLTADTKKIRIKNLDKRTGSVEFRSTGFPATGYGCPSEKRRNSELVKLLIEDDRREPFDIIHSHYKYHAIDELRKVDLNTKTLTHVHGNALAENYCEAPHPVICISKAQARCLQHEYDADVFDIVYHGLDSYEYFQTKSTAGILAWIGRFTWKKGADTAIKIARKSEMPLVLCAPSDNLNEKDERYFLRKVKRHVDLTDFSFLERIANLSPELTSEYIASVGRAVNHPAPIIYAGPADEAKKQTLFGNAVATLFPIKWSEPFGRVMIESMACGTPVIGHTQFENIHCGAVEEVIDEGETGFHVDAADEDDSVEKSCGAIRKAHGLDRSHIRRVFANKWNSERVARQLDHTYERFLPR